MNNRPDHANRYDRQHRVAKAIGSLAGGECVTDQTNGDRSRYSNVFDQQGEPYGELGLVTQRDSGFWQDQSGPPTDPQAGNIPGGKRDILRTADFDDRTMDAFSKDVGNFIATGGQMAISSETEEGVAAAVYTLDDY